MTVVKRFFAVAVLLSCLFALFYFRTVPAVQKIWNGYKVLYVENSVEEELVLAYLADNACGEVISARSQRIPLSSKLMYPQQSDGDSYLEERLAYFTDKQKEFNLFYIHEQYGAQLESAVKKLVKERRCRAGFDSKQNFPFIMAIVAAIVFLFLSVVAERKRYFILPAIFPVLLCLSQPFYTVAAASCLLQFALFLTNRLWERKNDVLQALKSFYIIVLTITALVIFAGQSVLCGLLSICVLAAGLASILLVRSIARSKAQRGSFSYTLIFSAEQIPVAHKKNMRWLLLLLLPLLLLFLCFLFPIDIDFLPGESKMDIAVPTPVAYTDEELFLPVMEDYFVWAWFTLTYPYRSLYDEIPQSVQEGDKVSIKSYRENGNLIEEFVNTVYTYNDDFKKQLAAYIADVEYPAIEKLLEKQDWNMRVTYTVPRKETVSRNDDVGFVLLLLALGVPFLLCVWYACFGRVKT